MRLAIRRANRVWPGLELARLGPSLAQAELGPVLTYRAGPDRVRRNLVVCPGDECAGEGRPRGRWFGRTFRVLFSLSPPTIFRVFPSSGGLSCGVVFEARGSKHAHLELDWNCGREKEKQKRHFGRSGEWAFRFLFPCFLCFSSVDTVRAKPRPN